VGVARLDFQDQMAEVCAFYLTAFALYMCWLAVSLEANDIRAGRVSFSQKSAADH
jgi:hypothetical protein